MRNFVDHEEVQLEHREVIRARALLQKAFWFIAAGAALTIGVTFGTLSYFLHLRLPTVSLAAIAVVIFCSVVAGLLIAYCIQIRDRIYRVELHLLTVHNEILCIKEQLGKS